MSDEDRSSTPLRLGRAFVVGAFLVVAIGAAVTLLPPQNRENWPIMVLVDASMLTFFAYRWHRLRQQMLSGELSVSEFGADPSKHLLGPRLTYVLWFFVTLIAVFTVGIYQVASRG